MLTVVVSFFLLSIIVIVFIFVVIKRSNSKVKDIGEISLASIQEFYQLCNPGRNCSKEDVISFQQRHSSDKVAIEKAFYSYWIKKELKEEYKLCVFLDLYKNAILLQEKNVTAYNLVSCVNSELPTFYKKLKDLSQKTVYQFHHLIEHFRKDSKSLREAIKALEKQNNLQYTKNQVLSRTFLSDYGRLTKSNLIKKHNTEFVDIKKEELSSLFDSCLKYPLDDQQREAILHLEDNTLVISSAGSGKTSTMVGKAIYLVQEEKVPSERILVITYTRKAAGELSERLNIDGLSCLTFHALALKIISEMTNHTPSICSDDFMLNCFYTLLREDSNFKSSINQYILEMRSLMKLEHEYDTAYEYYNDRKKYGIQAMFHDMNNNIIFTKSEEERRICEWLSIHNIAFTYEEPYEINTSNSQYRQYKPDFSIYYTDSKGNRKRLYLEHFAIDKNNNVPNWFGTDLNNEDLSQEALVTRWEEANNVYNEGIEWKLQLHKVNNTQLIYTTSAMFHDRTIWKQLESSLKKCGVKYKELTPEELYQKLVQRDKGLEKSIFKLLEQFTTLQKANLVKWDELAKQASEKKDSRSSLILENIMKPFCLFYNEQLVKAQCIDFTDAILQASNLSKTGGWKDYDYILVDEFQDISKDRYLFLQSLRKDTQDCFTKLFCVGDDWQSIYRFSGSDMTLFYDFEKYFGFTKHCKIETTYRFHEPLIGTSSEFIQANPNQVEKEIGEFKSSEQNKLEEALKAVILSLESKKAYSEEVDSLMLKKKDLEHQLSKYQTIFELHSYINDTDEKRKIENIIKSIPEKETVLIIGRYNYNCRSLGFNFELADTNKKAIFLNLGGRRVRYMSVHGSKGLEADHVFLINCNRGINGFPSLIEDDPILSFVLSTKDQYENAEERRVFYVAITRARKKMYVFYDENRPSCFIEEVKIENEQVSQAPIPCPICGHGNVYIIKEGTGYYGDWVLLSCTNKTGGCPYFKLMNKNDYLNSVESFQERNQNNSVQENSIKVYKCLRSFLTSRS